MPTTGAVDKSDNACGGMSFAVDRVPPNVTLVLDRSGSMRLDVNAIDNTCYTLVGDCCNGPTCKWMDLKAAVTSLVQRYDSKLRLGLNIFSADDACDPGTVLMPVAGAGGGVLTQLEATHPWGMTPTGAALELVRQKGGLTDPSRANYVVLATDGIPTTECGDNDVAGVIDRLYNMTPPVKTFVIGFGGETASNPQLLNAWAVAGHTARDGAVKYYQSNSQADLKAAFDQIAAGVASCTLKLSQTPPDPRQLYVALDGKAVPPDASNGFIYDPGSNTVTLNGQACAQVAASSSAKVQVNYGCPVAPVQ
jgi:hypothetical protein